MAGTEYFGETAVQQRDHMPVDLHPLLQNSLTTNHKTCQEKRHEETRL